MKYSFSSYLYELLSKRYRDGYSYKGTPMYKVTIDDIKEVKSVAKELAIAPEWLANAINFETAGTWNPAITNSIGATGLIQFLPATAHGLGTTTERLRGMSFQEQILYVEKYLMNYKDKIKDNPRQEDLFTSIFYPAYVGKHNKTFPERVTKSNPGIETPMDYVKKVKKSPLTPFPDVPSDIVSYRISKGLSILAIGGLLAGVFALSYFVIKKTIR